MEEPIFSSTWYRVSGLKPRLRGHVQIHRHLYRGREWYVLQDHATGRFHRFSPEAYAFMGLFDGQRTLEEIWNTVSDRLKDGTPTQDEIIHLIAQLHRSDALQTDSIPDIEDLRDRSIKGRRNRILGYIRSPLSLRIPLLDPDRFLDRTVGLAGPLFSGAGLLLWTVLILTALVLAAMHEDALRSNITDRVFGLQNLLILGIIYPVIKAVHEFGHAYAVKRWGGEVHEMGIMFLVFMPIPYVDASAASAFRDKRHRMAVGAAGILVETFLAALAMMVWVLVEPGTVRAAAFNVMLIAGVSTLFFNGNPLLRYDAYYILTDLLEIPNLGPRSNSYLGYLAQRYLFGDDKANTTAAAPDERIWLGTYAVASGIYRTIVVAAICLYAASRFFFLGALIALWAVAGLVGYPLVKFSRSFLGNPRLRRRRTRVILVSLSIVLLVTTGFCFVPIPLFTMAEGVVWPPGRSEVRAEADGFIEEVLAAPGTRVHPGDPLIRCANPELFAMTKLLDARLRELLARHRGVFQKDPVQAGIIEDEMGQVKAELQQARERLSDLTIRSAGEGVFLLPDATDLPGRFILRGTPLGYVTDFSRLTVRVIVPQTGVQKVRSNTRKVEMRLAEHIPEVRASAVIREIPGASAQLPSAVFSTEGGGSVMVDPTVQGEPQAFDPFFQFELQLSGAAVTGIGERVYVRFRHDPEPLAFRCYRSIRHLLLRRLNV